MGWKAKPHICFWLSYVILSLSLSLCLSLWVYCVCGAIVLVFSSVYWLYFILNSLPWDIIVYRFRILVGTLVFFIDQIFRVCICSRTRAVVPALFELLAGEHVDIFHWRNTLCSLTEFILCVCTCPRTRAAVPVPFELLTGGHVGIFHWRNTLCLFKNSNSCAYSFWSVNNYWCRGHVGIFQSLNTLCLHLFKNSSSCNYCLCIVSCALCGSVFLIFPSFVCLVGFLKITTLFSFCFPFQLYMPLSSGIYM